MLTAENSRCNTQEKEVSEAKKLLFVAVQTKGAAYQSGCDDYVGRLKELEEEGARQRGLILKRDKQIEQVSVKCHIIFI